MRWHFLHRVNKSERTQNVLSFFSFEIFFHAITGLCAFSVLVVLLAILLVLWRAAAPAVTHFGWHFLFSEEWNPVTDQFGAFTALYGTLASSCIALLLAVPVSFTIAFFLTEIAPVWLRRPIGTAIELLAGIPSVIYGIWAFFVLAPFLHQLQPAVTHATAGLPVLADLFKGPFHGVGLITASCVLAIMILPYITAFMRDVFETVPILMKESAYAMGATPWDVVRHIVWPSTQAGVVGGAILGLGRALGETMAVTFVIGNAHHFKISLFAPGTTLSATIASEFNEAMGTLYPSSLMALGFILCGITFVVLIIGRGLMHRIALPEGGR